MEHVPYTVADAQTQLARTEALMHAVAGGQAPATLRWYSYTTPALILGIGQTAALVDEPAAAAAGFAVERRSSGGGVVVAGPGLLALDVVLPGAHPLALSDVVEAYHWLGVAFLHAIHAAAPSYTPQVRLVSVAEARADREGVRAALPGSRRHLESLVCFGSLSPYEVALDTNDGHEPIRKLVGLSQIRKRGVVVYQAGVYVGAVHNAQELVPIMRLLRPSDKQVKDDVMSSSALLMHGWAASLADVGLGQAEAQQIRQAVSARAAAAARTAGAAAAAGR